jgi:hypothetical protein
MDKFDLNLCFYKSHFISSDLLFYLIINDWFSRFSLLFLASQSQNKNKKITLNGQLVKRSKFKNSFQNISWQNSKI